MPTEDTVLYVLEVDPSEIIYFDSIKWDHVLNHLYVPKDQEDEASYKKELESRGYDKFFDFLNEKTAHFYPRERKKVMDSWVRVFEIDDWNVYRVQANIWEIRQEMIKDIIFCHGGKKGEI